MDEHTEPESPADGDPGRTGPTAAGDTATGATNVAGNEPAEQPSVAQQFAGPGTGPGWQRYAGPGTGPGWQQQYAAPGAYPPPAGSSWHAGHSPGAPADGTVPPGYPAPGAPGYPAPGAAGYAAPGYAAPGAQPPAGASPGRPTWGAPPAALPATASQTRTRWKPWKKVAAGATLAAVVAVGGVAAVTAANASNESGSTQPGQGGNGAGGFGPGAAGYGIGSGTGMPGGAGFGGRGSAMALAEALHGEFVVETDSGGTQTERLQRGQVTAVSAGSLSVSSTDGFAATYVIGSDLDVSGVAVGDTVRVVATVDGSTVTAISMQSGTAGGPGGTGQGSGTSGGAGELTPPGNGQSAPQTS